MENIPFFKKYKIIKIIVIAHLIFSLFVTISLAIHGFNEGNITIHFIKNYQNYIALSNPEKYLKEDFFIVDTAYIEVQTRSNMTSSPTFKDYTIIKGNLLHSKIKQEMICHYVVQTVLDHKDYKNKKTIKVLKNSINGVAFLGDKSYLVPAKDNAFGSSYFLISIVPLILILIILIIKSK
ncbi:hypothetical protein [Flavobacterium hungaricum]|uniref:Uncharacterized protein n=1 Tax=Flavobacterium hungaricum TaxID=2082725 RepID=A0ABR9TH41_9FLAO|nr:hypothetical protein [Flavobacterium hungaricum]MBE8723982.1 hypothetical protein [Flavobacterium hungaricum]